MTSRKIPARFKGKCRICGKAVQPGEMVWFAKHYGVRCEACGPHTANDAPLPAKRGKKGKSAEPSVPMPDVPVMPGERVAAQCADGVWRYEFGSVTDATADALTDYAQNDANRKDLRQHLEDSLTGHRSWANYFTTAKFMRELSTPGKALLEAVDEMRSELIGEVSPPRTPRRRVRHGQEFGDEMDVDRWFRRDLNPWDRSVREQQPRRNVTIGCNLSVNAGNRPEDLIYRGAAALALADILTSQGFNVSVVAFESCVNPTSAVAKGVIKYTLKDSTMPLDIHAVAFAMCEIAWVRIVGIIGEMRHFPGTISPGYGRAVPLFEADRKSCDFVIDKGVTSKEAAAEWLKAVLAGKPESEVAYV